MAKEQNMSLLAAYRDTTIPVLEEKVVQKYSKGGEKNVCIVNQEGGAGLHTDKNYLSEMQRLFTERDWILFNQLSHPFQMCMMHAYFR